MYKFLQKQVTTGQFAAIYGINKRTLMYYDDIGLFKPATVRENGYRYYTYGQGGLFDVIQLLRKLRIPLEEIKNHLTDYTPQTLRTLLDNQNQKLEQEIAELMWLQRVVRNKIDNMEAKLSVASEKIEIVEATAQAIVVSEATSGMSMEQTMKVMVDFAQDCYHSRIYSGYPMGHMLDAPQMQWQGIFNQLSRCFYRVDEKTSEAVNRTYKPAGRYLVTHYKGPWPEMDQAFQRLVDYANGHDLTFMGHAYVESILDEAMATAEDPYYCEVRISVLLE